MPLTAISEFRAELTVFAHRWGLPQAYVRPMSVSCGRCQRDLELVMATDTPLSAPDTNAFIVIELISRGWFIRGRTGVCPTCR
jgi:hypothetical protein